MGFLWVIIKAILKKFADLMMGLLPPEMRKPIDFIEKIKKPFNFLGTNTEDKKQEAGIKGLIKRILALIKRAFKTLIKAIGKICLSFSDVLIVVFAVIIVGVMLSAILGAFGAFNGRITIDFDKFEELNADESVYMDAQNTNELRKAYMQLVSETSYYQVFNLRDLNPNSMNPYLEAMAKVINVFYEIGVTDTQITQEDLNYYNMSRSILGWISQDERYIYSDANKNALKYMKLPKVTGIGVEVGDLINNLNLVNDNFRDYYNRETTFQISETLLSEMNRILFGEFSNVESITYPEAFVKPVAFVNDFYRIQEFGKKENIGEPYVYVTQRVTLRDINNMSSPYYQKDWLEGIIKSEPSHIVYDYVVEQKNNYYWSDAQNDLATQMAWGNIGKYSTVKEEIEYEDSTTIEKESAIKLYWRVKDKDKNSSDALLSNGNNPFNEHMGETITKDNYEDYFEGPYTRINVSNGNVSIDTSSRICNGTTAVVYINAETGNSSTTYKDGWVKVRCEYNKYPLRHMQLVSVFDEYGQMQLNSRVLFNKTFVQKKSVRDSYRFFPEYFSGFEDFANVDLDRMAPAIGLESLFPSSDAAIENGTGNCTEEMYADDMKKPFSERKCSIIRRYTGTNGYAYVRAKFREWGQGISNFFTGEDKEAEINISSEAMFYLLLAYDDYIIETGEYGVAWDYKYYTETALDLDFRKAQFRDVFGFKEIFVDSWNDTAVYKQTLDTVKALDNQRTISTTYVPTSVISGQSALYKDQSGNKNNNNNNSGYGWKISSLSSTAGGQVLERVKGEASLEAPIYSKEGLTNKLIEEINKTFANAVYYGKDDFRYYYNSSGDLIDTGDKSWENYIAGLDNNISDDEKVKDENGNNISVFEALKSYNEGGDWRNTSEAWDENAKVYRPINSSNIRNEITSKVYTVANTTYNPQGRVSYRTYQGDYLPFETKSVRDYGLGSVLSYIQDMRVVYQTGVFMDEAYVGASTFKPIFDSTVGSEVAADLPKSGNGYYPKELLDKYPSLVDALRATPIPVQDLMSLAQNIVSLQYTATDYEMDLAEELAGSADYNTIRDKLAEIISGRNMGGIYISELNEGMQGFKITDKNGLQSYVKNNEFVKNNKSTNVCSSAEDECKDIDADDYEAKRQCLLNAQANGSYFNEGLFDCQRRCETEADTSIKGIHPDYNEDEKAELEASINEKKNKCLNICKQTWPEVGKICAYSADPSALSNIYAYSPYLKPTYWENFADKLFGWFSDSAKTYTQLQFLDPLQYYIEWFDFKAEDEDSIISRALHFLEGSDFVSEIHIAGSAYLQSIKNTSSGLGSANVGTHPLNINNDFGNAGTNIVGEFKQDFYNQYGSDLEPMNLIVENESYRVYMIDEAVTFLGTFTYTYKNDIVNIGGASSDRQVSGLAYADRYYYLSNYIFNIPKIEYKVQAHDSGTLGGWSQQSCPSYSVSDANTHLNGEKGLWGRLLSFISGDYKPNVLDTGVSCQYRTESRLKKNGCYESPTCVKDEKTGKLSCSGGGYYDCYKTYYLTDYVKYASVSEILPAEQGYIIDTPSEVEALLNKASALNTTSTLRDRVYIGMKVYDSLSDWSWSITVNNATDINTEFSHDYDVNYTSGVRYIGDTNNHYQNIKDVNNNIGARSGYLVDKSLVSGVDGLGLPDDLHMEINLEDGLKEPEKLKTEDLSEILSAANELVPFRDSTQTVSGGSGYSSVTLDTGSGLIDDADEIGVGLFMANREAYGYPIPLFRHFAGQMREILPRQRGYYFNGEVFDSWNSRLILTEETTPAQKDEILKEKNKAQSYLYDYIMNFEAYVPMDVKSDYDLMSRARDAYHSGMSTKVNHVENTAVLSSDIYNAVNNDAWKDILTKLGNDLDAKSAAQLVSGLLEVSIQRAPRKMITILNQNISSEEEKILDNDKNRTTIKNAINGTLSGGNTTLNGVSDAGDETETAISNPKVEVLLELKNGSSKVFRLTDLGPGVIFYNYNRDASGNLPSSTTISTSNISVNCGAGTDYPTCFTNVSLTISETEDERLNKNKSIEYVSTKFGKLVQKYGNVNYAILAYFHGEEYATKMQSTATDDSWMNSDNSTTIANILAEITGDSSVIRNADKIDTFMYTGSVVKEVLGYVQDTAAKTVMNKASLIPAAASGVQLGTKVEYAQQVYQKWQPLFDTYCAKYEVDLALAVAMFTQESGGNSYSGMCGGYSMDGDGINSYANVSNRTCTKLTTNIYNGGGGVGQIHATGLEDGDCSTANGEFCTRTLISKKTGESVSVRMASPYVHVKSVSDIPAFLAKDDRYGNVDLSFEWAITLISNLLIESDNDGFKAAARYNGWPSSCKLSDPNWYSCYASHRCDTCKYPNYIKHVARYYDSSLATAELNTNFGVLGSSNTTASFGLETGNLSYQRDMFQIQNSGVELYRPKMTTSRNDVTTLILNVSNFGKEDYYMYANEHNLLSLFTARLEDSSDKANSLIDGNPQIVKLGEHSPYEVDASYKFAYMTPLIPMTSPIGKTDGGVVDISSLNYSSYFGYRNAIVNSTPTSNRAMHNGVDLAYTSGTPVIATAEGRVYKALSSNKGYGNHVVIEHTVPPNTIVTDSSGKRYQIVGLYSLYAHMTSYRVNEGDVISKNCSSAGGSGKCISITEPIGFVGSTGNSTGNHLHYEIYVQAKDLDTGKLLDNSAQNSKCDPRYWLTTEWKYGSASLVEGGLDPAEIAKTINTVKSYYPNLSSDREALLTNALTLVGQVKYFWGGGHEGTPYKGINPAWLDGSTAIVQSNSPGGKWKAGAVWRNGLDCSGFVGWVSYNTFDFSYGGTNVQGIANSEHTKLVSKQERLPGDWAYTSGYGHIGIYLYTDENGQDWYVHCADGTGEPGVIIGMYNGFVNFLRADYVN